ncbi:MAG TPA: sensor domain-containing protein [Acidimicrobiales bacterium]|nr:sensor domain-containing protein [Acidimicrobiales bacterium]
MTKTEVDGSGGDVQVLGEKERLIVVSEVRLEQGRRLARIVVHEPLGRRAWRELLYFVLGGLLTGVAVAFIALTMFTGIALLITFIGVIIVAASVRGSRGFGRYHRALARNLMVEDIDEPEPFASKPGFFGWLQSALRDRVGWRAMWYSVLKVPLVIVGTWFALSVWIDAFFCLTYPVWGSGNTEPKGFGVVWNLFPPGYLSIGTSGFLHGLSIFITGLLLVLLAPWTMRLIVRLDRWLMRLLLSPDPVTARMRTLEDDRARTVDASVATLRRIERDLHDGTQAQLVALAMRLGQAKEKLAEPGELDLDQVRRLVDEAHRGAKETIVELRDLARGIHPPVLDTGLEGALSTLAARSTLPTELTVELRDRPTPTIETIAYFCVAELLANVAQHAQASRATIGCVQHGQWLRLVVRDDGRGGARPSAFGSSSSGLAGLTDRVHTVDGHLSITSPIGGPTVVTVDLPMHG